MSDGIQKESEIEKFPYMLRRYEEGSPLEIQTGEATIKKDVPTGFSRLTIETFNPRFEKKLDSNTFVEIPEGNTTRYFKVMNYPKVGNVLSNSIYVVETQLTPEQITKSKELGIIIRPQNLP